MSQTLHCGVVEEDPRNHGPIAYFRPPDITPDYVRGRLAAIFRHETPAQIEARVARFMADMAAKPPRPPPPLGQGLEEVTVPVTGLGVHPDIIEQIWRLDRALPLSCRWVVWGHPALVHPRTGVIFAVAIGSIGVVARLPPALRGAKPAVRPTSLGEFYDISAAGPEWRFLDPRPEEAHGRAAFDYAEAPLDDSD
ncbi:MAG TPA: hypothetical protein VF459_16965 [Caulobacteraceae bacterium]